MDALKLAARKPLRILLAEDNKVNQILTLGLLRSLGYESGLASNGLQAVEAAKSGDYDLILMDCQLPELDGYAAAAEIKQRLGIRSLIAAYTAHVSAKEMERSKAAGMEFVLAKPITLEALVAILEQAYDRLHLAS